MAVWGQTLTLEKERALGAGLAAEIRNQAGPLEIVGVSAYLEHVGTRLASFVPGGEFRFEVVDSKGSEPVGLPGGFVLVPASFFLATEDESEFVGMLAHAMGHAHLRHLLVTRSGAGEGGIPLVFMGGGMGVHADSQQSMMLIPMGLMGAVRRYELEADRFGADLAARAGYDGAGLARYLKRVQMEDSQRPSPLPAKGERLAALAEFGATGGEVFGSEFLQVRELVRAALERKTPSLRKR